MITNAEYYSIVSEAYDLSDYKTKKALLFCNEAQKNSNISHIVERLYGHIKDGTDNIDFGTIPKSKGIITKVENFDQIVDCINTISALLKEYNEPTTMLDSLSTAINNIQTRENTFVKAFTMGIDFPVMIYNTVVLSIVSGLSVMISASIEYIKDDHDSYKMAFDKTRYRKSKDHVLFNYVTEFNGLCKTGVMDKLINECIKNNITSANESCDNTKLNNNITVSNESYSYLHEFGGVAAVIVAVGAGVVLFIKLIRDLIYYFKYTKMKLSDWFGIQATFLQINADNLKYREDPHGDAHRQKVYQRQTRLVQLFNKISNNLAIDDSKSQRDAENERRQEEKGSYEDDSNDDDGGLF